MRSIISRRRFFDNAAVLAGVIGLPQISTALKSPSAAPASSRMVNIGTVSINEMFAANPQEMVSNVLSVMDEVAVYKPDIICLPEIFAYAHIENPSFNLQDIAEKVPGAIVTPFLAFARKHHCYVICPTYSLSGGNVYVAAVLIDREGKVAGEYRKIRPAAAELEMGICPGNPNPGIFETDFGRIGIQICFDLKYEEGWKSLKDQGAEIIFWPSAYAAGQEISSMAWRHQVYIVSSTQKDTSKICDISGAPMAETGRWQRNWAYTSINLEKAFIPTWPAVSQFPAIQKKYKSAIRLTTFHEEEWTIIESLDNTTRVADILSEYGLKTMHETLKELSIQHEKARANSHHAQ